MRKFLLLAFFLFNSFSSFLFAQSFDIVGIVEPSQNYICSKQKIVLAIQKNGTFDANNKFTLQLLNNQNKIVLNLDTKDSSGFLVTYLPDFAQYPSVFDYEGNTSSFLFRFQMLSSSPGYTTGIFNQAFAIAKVPNVRIIDTTSTGVTRGLAYEMRLTGSGSFPMVFKTSEGASIASSSNNWIEPISLKTYPQKSGDFYIKEVSNMCGIAKVAGKVKLDVVDNFLSINDYAMGEFCIGNNVKIFVEKRGTWNTNNKFYIRFVSPYYQNVYFDVEAIETNDGALLATIPTYIKEGTYHIKIQSSSPKIASSNILYSIPVSNPSKMDIVLNNQTVMYGKPFSMYFNSSGLIPIFYTLNNGVQYKLESSGYSSIDITPAKSTEYKITKYQSVCNTGTGTNVLKVTVTNGIKIEEVLTSSICPGEIFKVRFSSQPVLAAKSTVYLNVIFSGGSTLLLTGKVTEAGLAEFKFPESSPHAGKRFDFSLYSDNIPEAKTEYNISSCLFKSKPTLDSWRLEYYSKINLSNPDWIEYLMVIKGGGNVAVESSLGQKLLYTDANSELNVRSRFFASSNMPFSITKISNECGVIDNPNINFNVTVANSTTNLKLETPFGLEKTLCTGTKYDLTLIKNGVFADGTKFYLDYVNENGYVLAQNVGEFIGNKLTWTVPPTDDNFAGKTTFYLQVHTSSPYVAYERFKVQVSNPPSYTGEKEINYSESYSFNPHYGSISINSPTETMITFSNGQLFSSSNGYVSYKLNLDKETQYVINNIKNECGSINVNIKINVKIKERAVNAYNQSYENATTVCAGKKISFKYYETVYRPSAKVPKYKVLISTEGSSTSTQNKTLLTGVTQNPVEVTIPSDMPIGSYYIRLVDEEDSLNTTTSQFIRVEGTPSVALLTENSNRDFTIQYGDKVSLQLQSKNNSAFEGLIMDSNGNSYTFNGINEAVLVSPTKSTTYTVKSVYNQCGSQNLTEIVKVNVNPFVSWEIKSPIKNSLCKNDQVLVKLASYGNIDSTASYRFVLNSTSSSFSSKNYTISSLKPDGSYLIKMPTTAVNDIYLFTLVSASGKTIGRDGYIVTLLDVPNVTLEGNTTTMANVETTVRLRATDPTNYYNFYGTLNYELTNGTKGIISNFGGLTATLPIQLDKSASVSLKSISNQCGVGRFSGESNITITPQTSNRIITKDPTASMFFYKICTSSINSIQFDIAGDFSTIPQFGLEMSDSNGDKFAEIPVISVKTFPNNITFKLPSSTKIGGNYRFRVIAKQSGVGSSSNPSPIELFSGATVEFDSSQYYFTPDKPINLKLRTTGEPPIYFTVGTDEVSAKKYRVDSNDASLTLNPVSPTKYKIFSVSNSVCGAGSVGTKSIVSLELVTGFEDVQKLGVTVGPNPATDYITINTDNRDIKVELVNATGKILEETILNSGNNVIDLKNYPIGFYLLRISKDSRIGVFKVIKQ